MYTITYLHEFTREAFVRMGCPVPDADRIAEVFLSAEMRGIPSHGMIRLKDYYQLWTAGRVNTNPVVRIVHESPSTAVVDGDRCVGMVAAYRSMEIAIDKAKQAGTGWVATRNSNHFGIAGFYAMMALSHDMVGICLTNANPQVAPTFSITPMLGTNPVAVAIPAGNHPPVVADFATTPIARGKLVVAEKKGLKVPFGYVQDRFGDPSDDPAILKAGGSMVTLGGDYEHGSHKGYCLSAVVDIFSAVLSGANFGPFVPPSVAYLPLRDEKVGEGTGHFFGALRIDAFREAGEFRKSVDRWIETFRSATPARGHERVLIPGDPEREKEEKARKEGIELLPAVVEDLKDIAGKLGISFAGA